MKKTLLALCTPFDNLLKQKGHPPLWLRYREGPLGYFNSSNTEYRTLLTSACGLKTGSKLLELGCGCGGLLLDTSGAGELLDLLSDEGMYYGVDPDYQAIDWCRQRFPINAVFVSDYRSLPTHTRVDVVLAKSFFTRTSERELWHYLNYLSVVMEEGSRGLAGFYLISKEDFPAQAKRRFIPWSKTAYLISVDKPRLGVAYKEEYVLDLFSQFGFETILIPGTWRRNRDSLYYRDIVMFKKRGVTGT